MKPIGKPPRCTFCGDVIGVYEPLIALVDGQPQEIAQAVRHDREIPGHDWYHRSCFARRQREPPVLS